MPQQPRPDLAVTEELTRLVREEYDYLRHYYHRLWRLPLVRRVRQGRAVAGLRWERVLDAKRGIVRFAYTTNDSRFRAGDLLRLSRNHPTGNEAFEVTWYGEESDWIGAVFYQPSRLHAFLSQEPATGEWTLDESFVDLQDLYERAFAQLTASALGRDQVAPILAGLLTPSIDLAAFDDALAQHRDGAMNASQQEACAMAVAAQPFALIQGPPGTGKTRTLAEAAASLLERGERVLITALTHRAIHEALNKTCELIGPSAIAKIGLPVYDPGLQAKDYPTFRECPLAEAPGGYIIGATPFTLWTRRLADVEFDSLIVDEASQVTAPLAAMAMLRASRYVFVGDQHQLPPVQPHRPLTSTPDLDEDDNARDTERTIGANVNPSIFSRLRQQSDTTLLTTCYRMNAALCHWSSEAFYHGRLQAFEANAHRRLPWPHGQPDAPSEDSPWTLPAASVLVRLTHRDAYTESLEEAALVADLVTEWIAAGHRAEDLGVVVPYRRQANRVRRFLNNRRRFPPGTSRHLTVDTVERFQGSEREAMILSFTASDPDFARKQAPFLFLPERLNVAATRARSKRILLVSQALIEVAEKLSARGDEAATLFLSLLQESTECHGQAHS